MKSRTALHDAYALFVGAVVIAVILGGYGYYRYDLLSAAFAQANAKIAMLESALANASSTNTALATSLASASTTNNGFQSELTTLSSTVNSLDKLSQTDPELLEKYSKVYFLNENYTPASLSSIPSQYTYPDGKDYQFLTGALPHLESMLDAASSTGLNLEIISAYRSFGTQESLKADYVTTYGSGANTFSADEGYSEHQLGTAVDFTTAAIGTNFTDFDSTNEYTWLMNNAYQYGFILSYPPGNSYYIFEPWHWRYVGVALATYLHDHNEYFYDADQRLINSYLVNFYD